MSQLPENSQFGNYHIVRHIAGGGMAQIYLAKTAGLAGFEKYLALKVINPEYANEDRFIQMLIDEAKITVGLSHVNIGQVFDLGQFHGIYYIAMEFVDGVDILELVNGLHTLGEKVPLEAVAFIGRQMCSGLHYAHSRKDKQGKPLNIVHRDISPQNILVSRAGEVKVVDFGIAKAAGVSTKTQAGVIKGKVHYMAPEQAMGKKADHRSDIFAAGIVLWEMLTSQMVYSGENVRELVDSVRQAKIAAPSSIRPEVPTQLDGIVMKALSRRPEDRFSTAHEFQIELTKFLSSHASDYGSSNLAHLVERVREGNKAPPEDVEEHLSREDLIQDVHSVISGNKEAMGPRDRARLVVQSEQERRVQLLDQELVIGRAGQLAIPDARVSRRHARIYKQDECYVLEDMGSANGTYVNNLKITAPHILRDRDSIRIGSCKILFRAAEQTDVHDMSIPKLIITCGLKVQEKEIDKPYDINYQFHLGPARLEGVAGRVVPKNGEYWFEPVPSREPVTFNGEDVSSPTPLNSGDTFKVGEFLFEFRKDPTP